MKRTPPWVWVAAVAVQMAALGLCVWAMERHLRVLSVPQPALPADDGTQMVQGRAGSGTVVLGFSAGGEVRAVDSDGARYAGTAAGGRVRMRELEGTRAFTVQVGAAADGRLQASFTGGLHDGETIALDPLVRGTVV